MKKLNDVIYNKLVLQAEEANEQGFIHLAQAVNDSIGPNAGDDQILTYSEMEKEIYTNFWKAATSVIQHYDVTSADIETIDNSIKSLAHSFIERLVDDLHIDDIE